MSLPTALPRAASHGVALLLLLALPLLLRLPLRLPPLLLAHCRLAEHCAHCRLARHGDHFHALLHCKLPGRLASGAGCARCARCASCARCAAAAAAAAAPAAALLQRGGRNHCRARAAPPLVHLSGTRPPPGRRRSRRRSRRGALGRRARGSGPLAPAAAAPLVDCVRRAAQRSDCARGAHCPAPALGGHCTYTHRVRKTPGHSASPRAAQGGACCGPTYALSTAFTRCGEETK